ncbi:ankyrin repeat-containing domain protein [Aspergillus venezuelensis]
MSLLVLPNELLLIIAGHLDSKRDIEALGRTNKLLGQIATKALYQHNANHENSSALWAARRNRLDVVEEMLKCKADINVRDRNGLTSLLLSVKHGTIRMFEMILDRKPDLYLMGDWYPSSNVAVGPALFEAAWKGHPRKVKLLLDHGADVNHQRRSATRSGANALETSIATGLCDIAKILLDHGADIEKCGGIGIPLNVAILGGKIEIVKDLLGRGANINGLDDDNGTPLQIAVSHNIMDAARLLLGRGADINAIGRH